MRSIQPHCTIKPSAYKPLAYKPAKESDAGISDARLSDAGNTHIYLTGGPVPRGIQGLSNLPKDHPGPGVTTYETFESFVVYRRVLLPITQVGRVSLINTGGSTSSHRTLPNIRWPVLTGRTIHLNNNLHVYPSPDILINPSTDQIHHCIYIVHIRGTNKEQFTIPVIPNHTLWKQYHSRWAPETNWRTPHVSPLGPPLSWRELATTRGCPDNPHPPTADHNYNPYTHDTLTHKYNHIQGPIVTVVIYILYFLLIFITWVIYSEKIFKTVTIFLFTSCNIDNISWNNLIIGYLQWCDFHIFSDWQVIDS